MPDIKIICVPSNFTIADNVVLDIDSTANKIIVYSKNCSFIDFINSKKLNYEHREYKPDELSLLQNNFNNAVLFIDDTQVDSIFLESIKYSDKINFQIISSSSAEEIFKRNIFGLNGIYVASADEILNSNSNEISNKQSLLIFNCDGKIKKICDYIFDKYKNAKVLNALVNENIFIGKYNADDIKKFNDVSILYINPGDFYSREKYDFADFVDIIDVLRGPNGCPWDKSQTHDSLCKFLIEEAYETTAAVENNDMENLCEELGDVLLQILLHANIAKQDNEFLLDDVINNVAEKMIHRHAHIFGGRTANTPDEVAKLWEEIKSKDKGQKSATDSIMAIAKSLPTLMYSQKVQSKAAKYGFDFENIEDTMGKVVEEFNELKQEIYRKDKIQDRVEDELGDLLFSVINLARFAKVDTDIALRRATEKFKNRFQIMETLIKNDKKCLKDLTLDQIDVYWNRSKSQ